MNVLDRGLNRKINLLLIKLFGFVALLIYLKQLVVVPHDRVLVASELLDLLRVHVDFIVNVCQFGLRLREECLDFGLSFFDFLLSSLLKSEYLLLGLFGNHAARIIMARG